MVEGKKGVSNQAKKCATGGKKGLNLLGEKGEGTPRSNLEGGEGPGASGPDVLKDTK